MSKRNKKTRKIDVIYPAMALEMLTDDRAAAIMGAAFVEYTLRTAIQARLRNMDVAELEVIFDNNGHGALATFSQMIWMGYALNLYGPETRADLSVLKDIRNFFAHDPEDVDFTHAEIKKLCGKLKTPAKLSKLTMKAEADKPRRRYEDTLHFFAARFHIIGEKHISRPGPPPDMGLD